MIVRGIFSILDSYYSSATPAELMDRQGCLKLFTNTLGSLFLVQGLYTEEATSGESPSSYLRGLNTTSLSKRLISIQFTFLEAMCIAISVRSNELFINFSLSMLVILYTTLDIPTPTA